MTTTFRFALFLVVSLCTAYTTEGKAPPKVSEIESHKPLSYDFKANKDSSIVFYFNSINKNHRLMKELNWNYQIPDIIAPSSDGGGYKSFVSLNFDTIKNNVNYDKEDTFNVTLSNDTLILTKNNQRSFNDFTTEYKIFKVHKRRHLTVKIVLICYSKNSIESIETTYKISKGDWQRISYKKEYSETLLQSN